MCIDIITYNRIAADIVRRRRDQLPAQEKTIFEIVYEQTAWRAMDKLSPSTRARLMSGIEQLAIDPYPVGSKVLRGSNRWYRLRIASYRVIYRFDSEAE